MRIVLLGAGNVASHLGPALQHAGHELVQVYSRSEESASELAARLQVPFTVHTEDLVSDADIYLFSVRDAVLESLIREVAAGRDDALFVHTAGSISVDVFRNLGLVHGGVFYPMQTFSKKRPVDFAQIPVFVEVLEESDCQLLEELARSVSRRVYRLTSEKRRYLHLSAVFACNFANHCYALAAEMVERSGLPFDVLLPLIDETAAKVHTLEPRAAQTGPAVRYDENVLERQKNLLADRPDMQDVYDRMSRSIHALATKTPHKK